MIGEGIGKKLKKNGAKFSKSANERASESALNVGTLESGDNNRVSFANERLVSH